jgi:hypothetical protein
MSSTVRGMSLLTPWQGRFFFPFLSAGIFNCAVFFVEALNLLD